MTAFLGIWLLTFALLAVSALSTANTQIASTFVNTDEDDDQSLCGVRFASKAQSFFTNRHRSRVFRRGVTSHVIIVDQSGHGHLTKLQQAIDSVPPNNHRWIEIQVRPGVYREKVSIPVNKPYISLVGESKSNTVVQWWGGGGSDTLEYSTFSVFSSNVVARNITFKNLFHATIISQAPAVLVYGDKIAFYECGFIGVQDTVTDFMGRHLFEGCYIEGYIDFIWGYGQSMYHGCIINVTSGPYDDRIYGAGYITAQGRINMEDNDGFVFKYCMVVGTSYAYLGRPYQSYSRVLFYRSYLSNNVVPQGWNLGFTLGHGGSVTLAEVGCTGPGSDTSQRVKWGRSLASNELSYLINPNTFINQDNWIQNQPPPTTTPRRLAPKTFSGSSTTAAKERLWQPVSLPHTFPFAHARRSRASLRNLVP